jgi:hypothetical protein
MAWSTPLTAAANATLTAAQWNASVRDNLLMTAPALATTQGAHWVSSGPNGITERFMVSNTVGTTETTASTSYAALATAGPGALVTSYGRVMVLFGCEVTNNTGGSRSLMSYAVSGATTVAGQDGSAVTFTAPTAAYVVQASRVILQTVTSGNNTFTAQYRVLANTGSFGQRTMLLFPL